MGSAKVIPPQPRRVKTQAYLRKPVHRLSFFPGGSGTVPRFVPVPEVGKAGIDRYLAESSKSGPWTGMSGTGTAYAGAGSTKTAPVDEDTRSVAATQGST